MHELCGVRTGNYDTFNWKQVLFGERIPKMYGTSLEVLLFGPFGSNAMTYCLTTNNGMNLRSSSGSGMNLSFMPKRHGHVSSNK